MKKKKLITVTREERLAILTLRGSLHRSVVREMRAVLDELAKDESVGVLLVTGTGNSFVSDGDVRDLAKYTKAEALAGETAALFAAIESFPAPVIAAINGPALGTAFELALACDLRVAAETARFGFPQTGLGIVPGAGGTQRLPRLIGPARAKHMIFTGQILDALDAERLGLVSWVEPQAELMNAARVLAESILRHSPLAIRLAKMAINASAAPNAGLLVEALAQGICMDSQDKAEGTRAFLEKRKPEFKGK